MLYLHSIPYYKVYAKSIAETYSQESVLEKLSFPPAPFQTTDCWLEFVRGMQMLVSNCKILTKENV